MAPVLALRAKPPLQTPSAHEAWWCAVKPRYFPKFPVFAQDWLASSRILAMTAEQEGAFFRLCLIQWLEGALPSSDDDLLRLGRLAGTAVQHRLVLDAFATGSDGTRRNEKVAAVRSEAELYCGVQSEKGRKSGRSRRLRARTAVQSGSNRTRTETNPPSSELRAPKEEREKIAPRPGAPARRIPETTHAKAIEWWCAEIEKRCGHRPHINGKDAVAVAGIRKALGDDLPTFQRHAGAYFDDPFHRRTGFTLAKFGSALEAIRARMGSEAHGEGALPWLEDHPEMQRRPA